MKSEYVLGESAGETARLTKQAQQDSIEPRLRWGGLAPGMSVIDAGCGPGETTRAIGRIVGPTGKATGFDVSQARIDAARAHPTEAGSAPLHFVQGDIFAPPLPPGEADFVFSQYVLEHVPNPQDAVTALARLLRPGGKLLLVDIDGVGVNHWPAPPIVEEGVPLLLKMLARTGFDAYVGRKLYAFAVRAGLKDINVMLYPATLSPGAASLEEQLGWKQRFEAMAPLGVPGFGSQEKWEAFVSAYLAMLADTGSFKYSLGVSVQGIRP